MCSFLQELPVLRLSIICRVWNSYYHQQLHFWLPSIIIYKYLYVSNKWTLKKESYKMDQNPLITAKNVSGPWKTEATKCIEIHQSWWRMWPFHPVELNLCVFWDFCYVDWQQWKMQPLVVWFEFQIPHVIEKCTYIEIEKMQPFRP